MYVCPSYSATAGWAPPFTRLRPITLLGDLQRGPRGLGLQHSHGCVHVWVGGWEYVWVCVVRCHPLVPKRWLRFPNMIPRHVAWPSSLAWREESVAIWRRGCVWARFVTPVTWVLQLGSGSLEGPAGDQAGLGTRDSARSLASWPSEAFSLPALSQLFCTWKICDSKGSCHQEFWLDFAALISTFSKKKIDLAPCHHFQLLLLLMRTVII